MKHKFSILLSENENELLIREFSELDKGTYVNVFESKYDKEAMQAACENDDALLVSLIRTQGFYPVNACADLIARGIKEFFASGCTEINEITFNDVSIMRDSLVDDILDEDDPSSVELDSLLDDESSIEDDSILGDDDIDTISPSTPSLKIADDDGMQTDEDI